MVGKEISVEADAWVSALSQVDDDVFPTGGRIGSKKEDKRLLSEELANQTMHSSTHLTNIYEWLLHARHCLK